MDYNTYDLQEKFIDKDISPERMNSKRVHPSISKMKPPNLNNSLVVLSVYFKLLRMLDNLVII
jgi:hypothetical protein